MNLTRSLRKKIISQLTALDQLIKHQLEQANTYIKKKYGKHTAVGYSPNMPDWIEFIDCQQVGYNSRGCLIAFDFG
jgi:hypothetical protein